MRVIVSSVALLLLSASAVVAQGNNMTSGRPSAVLNDEQCQSIWQMASPHGDALSKDQAVPFIVNFQIADVDGDGKISADEFKQACGKGMVKNTTGQ